MLENKHLLQNRYEIESPIGTGGMGAVYTAIDKRFGTKVAVKQSLATGARLSLAFEREAQLLNSLRHYALPHVTDYFAEGDNEFIVMQYIDGEDLAQTIERCGTFAPAQVLQWADELLDALEYLHTQKTPIIHRDIKPQNLKLAPDNKIILLDFGLAKGASNELANLTMSKSIYGYSRNYAPLEQIQGTGTDARSDLYSLAATVYHLLTGKAPVDALTRAKVVLSDTADLLRPVNFLNPEVSPEVAEILHRALSLNQNARPESAAAMRRELKEARRQRAIAPPLADPPKQFAQPLTAFRMLHDDAQTNAHHDFEPDTKTSLPAAEFEFARLNSEKLAAQTVKIQLVETKKLFARPTALAKLSAATLLLGVATFAALNYSPLFPSNAAISSATESAAVQPTENKAQSFGNAAAPTEQFVAEQLAAEQQPPAETHAFAPLENESLPETNSAAQSPKSSATTASKPQPANAFAIATAKPPKVSSNKPAAPNQPLIQPKTAAVAVNIQPAQTPAKPLENSANPENNDKDRKGKGFKGFFGKIGSGAMKIPKSIFGNKKD